MRFIVELNFDSINIQIIHEKFKEQKIDKNLMIFILKQQNNYKKYY